MNCQDVHARFADLLFEGEGTPEFSIAGEDGKGNSGLAIHLAGCDACRQELTDLRATMAQLDAWVAPEPNPYFLTRLNARLDEEREAAPLAWPLSWYEKLRARFVYGSRLGLRPVAAMALSVMVLVGGGAYLGLSNPDTAAVPQPKAAVVGDLQTLDNNAQLLDQLEALSSQTND